MNGFAFDFIPVTGCARDISINPLECLSVFCNKLCTRLWLRQLGVQFEWHNECNAVTTVHLFILLVNVNTDNDWRDANTRKWCRILVCSGRFFSWRIDFRNHRRWVFRSNCFDSFHGLAWNAASDLAALIVKWLLVCWHAMTSATVIGLRVDVVYVRSDTFGHSVLECIWKVVATNLILADEGISRTKTCPNSVLS